MSISEQAPHLPDYPDPHQKKGGGFWKLVSLLLLLALIALALFAFFYIKRNFYASKFKPTELNAKEEQVLDAKWEALSEAPPVASASSLDNRYGLNNGKSNSPEYQRVEQVNVPDQSVDDYMNEQDNRSEEEKRRIVLSEKEINAALHKNTDLADRVKIDLDTDMIRAAAVIPIDPEAPFIGGKTLRGKVSLKAYLDENGRLAVIVQDVTFGGLPLPNAWVGNLKGKNLVSEGGNSPLKQLAEGIKDFRIEGDQIVIQLNE